MSRSFEIDSSRRRSLRSSRLWVGVGIALAAMGLLGPVGLLWTVHHPIAWILAFPLGHLAFGISVLTTTLSLKMAWHATIGSMQLLYRPYGGGTMLFYFLLAFSEEVIFRALPLSHLEGTWWQVLLLSMVFSLVHVRKASRSRVLALLDFFLFGLLLSGLFLWSGDLWPLVIVHWVRNVSVAKVFFRKGDC